MLNSNPTKINYPLLLLALGIISLLLLSFKIFFDRAESNPIDLPFSDQCYVQGCHGLDFTCDNQEVQMCDLMYQIGDGCRQYASCEKVEGSCMPKYTTEFTACKTCVEECMEKYGDNPEVFQCESQCYGNN